jgi:hypothetical protein
VEHFDGDAARKDGDVLNRWDVKQRTGQGLQAGPEAALAAVFLGVSIEGHAGCVASVPGFVCSCPEAFKVLLGRSGASNEYFIYRCGV